MSQTFLEVPQASGAAPTLTAIIVMTAMKNPSTKMKSQIIENR